MTDKLRVRIVDDVITTDTAGGVVESMPVLYVGDDPVQNTAGEWVEPVDLEEADDGVPVRFVDDAVVLNSAGIPVAATPSKGGFSIDAFMAAQSEGLYYDFSKTDRMFQENTGPTPADDAGEVIGLALDQRAWEGETFAQLLAGQTNGLRNPTMAGAAGGSPGAIPTNWVHFGASGLTRTIASGTLGDGTPYIDIRWAGIASGTYTQVNFEGANVIAAALNQTYSISVDLSVVAGSTANINSFLLMMPQYDASSNFLYNISPSNLTSSLTGSAQRVAILPTVTAASAAYVSTGFSLNYANGAAIDITLRVANPSLKFITGKHGVQPTLSFRPKYQAGGGAAFDGLDDNLLTAYTAGAEANFIVAKVTVPATLSGTQMIAGASDAGLANSFLIGIRNDGHVGGGVGSSLPAVLTGGPDLRSQTAVVGLSFNGSTVRVFANDAVVYSGAQTGVPTTSIPVRLGAFNNNGTASNFFGGSIDSEILVGREFIDLARFKQIASKL